MKSAITLAQGNAHPTARFAVDDKTEYLQLITLFSGMIIGLRIRMNCNAVAHLCATERLLQRWMQKVAVPFFFS